MGNGLTIGVSGKCAPRFGQIRPDFSKIFDDSIMDQTDLSGMMGVGILLVGRAVGRPARVRNSREAVYGRLFEVVFQIDDFAFGASPLNPVPCHQGDTRRIISPIFQAPQAVHEPVRYRIRTGYGNDSAHGSPLLKLGSREGGFIRQLTQSYIETPGNRT